MYKLVIIGLKPGLFKVGITEPTDKVGIDKEILMSEIIINFEGVRKFLKRLPKKFKIEEFLVGYDGIFKRGSFKNSFNYEEHLQILIDTLKALKKEKNPTAENTLSEDLEKFTEDVDKIEPKTLFEKLMFLLNLHNPETKGLVENVIPKTDSEYLGMAIEIYGVLYASGRGIDYTEKIITQNSFIKRLLDYELKDYNGESLQALGLYPIVKKENGVFGIYIEKVQVDTEIPKIMN